MFTEHPKCWAHNESWVEIYPDNDKRLVKYKCGCIDYKEGAPDEENKIKPGS